MVTAVSTDSMDVALAVAQEYLLRLVQEASIPIGRAMLSSGIIHKGEDGAVVARLVRATVTAACRATLEEVDRMQKELVNGEARRS
jgi:hypothetical protein